MNRRRTFHCSQDLIKIVRIHTTHVEDDKTTIKPTSFAKKFTGLMYNTCRVNHRNNNLIESHQSHTYERLLWLYFFFFLYKIYYVLITWNVWNNHKNKNEPNTFWTWVELAKWLLTCINCCTVKLTAKKVTYLSLHNTYTCHFHYSRFYQNSGSE